MSDDEPLAPTALAPRSIHPSAGILLPSDWITLGAPVERPDPRPGPRASREDGIGGVLK